MAATDKCAAPVRCRSDNAASCKLVKAIYTRTDGLIIIAIAQEIRKSFSIELQEFPTRIAVLRDHHPRSELMAVKVRRLGHRHVLFRRRRERLLFKLALPRGHRSIKRLDFDFQFPATPRQYFYTKRKTRSSADQPTAGTGHDIATHAMVKHIMKIVESLILKIIIRLIWSKIKKLIGD